MEKKVEACFPFFLSKQRPSAEGAAKIFEKFIPQMEKKGWSMLNIFSSEHRPSAEGAAKILKNLSHKAKKC